MITDDDYNFDKVVDENSSFSTITQSIIHIRTIISVITF